MTSLPDSATLDELIQRQHTELRDAERKTYSPCPQDVHTLVGMITHVISCITVLHRTYHLIYSIFTHVFPLSSLSSAFVLLIAVSLVPSAHSSHAVIIY